MLACTCWGLFPKLKGKSCWKLCMYSLAAMEHRKCQISCNSISVDFWFWSNTKSLYAVPVKYLLIQGSKSGIVLSNVSLWDWDYFNFKKCQITHKAIGQCGNYNRGVTHTKVFCRIIKHGSIFTNVHLKWECLKPAWVSTYFCLEFSSKHLSRMGGRDKMIQSSSALKRIKLYIYVNIYAYDPNLLGTSYYCNYRFIKTAAHHWKQFQTGSTTGKIGTSIWCFSKRTPLSNWNNYWKNKLKSPVEFNKE